MCAPAHSALHPASRHLRPPPHRPGAVSECGHCHRSLMDAGSRHCSLECKLNWQQRAPPLTQEQVRTA